MQRYKSLAGFTIYVKTFDMCFARDMPCGALRDLYHIECKYIAFSVRKKYRIAKRYIAKSKKQKDSKRCPFSA
ncbi:MAG: hypothetical protein IKU23_01925, partial [Clostridia bacterium]|nr:hypothetical protein [Clostridia bacterium]